MSFHNSTALNIDFIVTTRDQEMLQPHQGDLTSTVASLLHRRCFCTGHRQDHKWRAYIDHVIQTQAFYMLEIMRAIASDPILKLADHVLQAQPTVHL